MKHHLPMLRSLAIACALLAAGCGRDRPTADTAPFETAVNAYLETQAMDMKVGRFRHLEVTDDTARGNASLVHAGGAAGVSVQWGFSFSRRADGTWQVTSCRR